MTTFSQRSPIGMLGWTETATQCIAFADSAFYIQSSAGQTEDTMM